MSETHIFPKGESFVTHGREDCACKPERVVTRSASAVGRGRHQGYKTNVIWYHHPLKNGDSHE